ncbi:MAG: hypothetical protein ACRERS_08265, partial [Methylococcales bacterium]
MPRFYIRCWLLACLIVPLPAANAVTPLPNSERVAIGKAEPFCDQAVASDWRKAQEIEGVKIQQSEVCSPDNPN